MISTKFNQQYSQTINWLRCQLTFSLLRSEIMCILGSRSSAGHPVHPILSEAAIDHALHEGHGTVRNVDTIVPNVNMNTIFQIYVYIYHLNTLALSLIIIKRFCAEKNCVNVHSVPQTILVYIKVSPSACNKQVEVLGHRVNAIVDIIISPCRLDKLYRHVGVISIFELC